MSDTKRPRRKKQAKTTVRDQAAKDLAKKAKQPRRKKAASAVTRPASGIGKFLGTSLHIADHKEDGGRVHSALTKQRSIVPRYFRESFQEIREVTWPRFPEALRLTIAVFLFSAALALIVSGLDWLLSRAFEEIILNESQNIREFIQNIF